MKVPIHFPTTTVIALSDRYLELKDLTLSGDRVTICVGLLFSVFDS